ncbi:type II toxin-antitoxin system RelE/ParE family toxin [Roseobacter fucihabitans]|nr:type II toxin-antitoxin system RelE/ParE family toxin [Roseobacter litoralis]
MAEIIKTKTFDKWLQGLRDRTAMARILVRLNRLAEGNAGDVKPVGGGISELRVNYGPGYRIYYLQRGSLVVVLLCGGDKGTQTKDIKTAKELAQKWKD